MNHKHHHLYPDIVEVLTADRFVTLYLNMITCKYCIYKTAYFRANGLTGTPPRVKNLYRMSEKCNMHLFASHF